MEFRWAFWRISAGKGPWSFCFTLLQKGPAEGASRAWHPNSFSRPGCVYPREKPIKIHPHAVPSADCWKSPVVVATLQMPKKVWRGGAHLVVEAARPLLRKWPSSQELEADEELTSWRQERKKSDPGKVRTAQVKEGVCGWDAMNRRQQEWELWLACWECPNGDGRFYAMIRILDFTSKQWGSLWIIEESDLSSFN